MTFLPPHRRVVLTRTIAARYLVESANPEFRLTILLNGMDTRNIPGFLANLRSGRIRLGGISRPPDFGVREEFDSITVWSSDEDVLRKVAAWVESRGFETSGVH
jgi:hypothetical protein